MFVSPTPSIITFRWSRPWPTTTIMVWVHGNELSWPLALTQRLATNPTIDTGTVFCVFANPKALKANIRQTDCNMNRCFTDTQTFTWYEAERANDIIPYLRQSDFLLDIHNTINNSTPAFLISEHIERNKYFPVQTILCWLDALHPWWSDGYMNSLGKVWLCLECGSIVDDIQQTTQIAYDAIENFLRATNNLDQPVKTYPNKQKIIRCREIYKNTHWPFRLVCAFDEFERVKVGTVIGYDGEQEVITQDNCCLVFARDCAKIGEECFVWGV